MKKLIIFIFLLASTSLLLTAEENSTWDWKDNASSTTYGVAVMPVTITNSETGLDETFNMPGLDIRLFNGKNITERGGFYTGTEVGLIIFLSTDEAFQDTYTGSTSGSVDYTLVNSDSFIGTVFVLAKYGYRLDLGVKLFGISLGWEMGIGARIASGNFDYHSSDIGGYEVSRSKGYETTAMSMLLDTAVEASVRLGTGFRFVGKVGVLLTPPFINLDDTYAGIGNVGTVSETDAQKILDSYKIESFPVIATARVGFIISY